MSQKNSESSKEPYQFPFFLSARVSAIYAIIGLLIVYLSIALAVTISASWFNWWTNALSDLGHPWMIGGINGVPGINPAAPIFNGGLILTSIFTTLFGIHLLLQGWKHKSPIGIIGAFLFIIAMVSLGAVGVFYEAILLPHIIAAMTLFIVFMIASYIIGIAFILRGTARTEGIIALIMGITITAILFLGFSNLAPWTGAAIPETIMLVAATLWIIPVCIRLLQNGSIF